MNGYKTAKAFFSKTLDPTEPENITRRRRKMSKARNNELRFISFINVAMVPAYLTELSSRDKRLNMMNKF